MGFVIERLLTPGAAAHLDGGFGTRVAGRGTIWRNSRFKARRRCGDNDNDSDDDDDDDDDNDNDDDDDNNDNADKDDNNDDTDNGHGNRQRAGRARYRKADRYRGCTRRLGDEDADHATGAV